MKDILVAVGCFLVGVMVTMQVTTAYHSESKLETSKLHLYGMDFKNGQNYSQIYVVAGSEQEATSAARDSGKDITSVRKIDVPILVVR